MLSPSYSSDLSNASSATSQRNFLLLKALPVWVRTAWIISIQNFKVSWFGTLITPAESLCSSTRLVFKWISRGWKSKDDIFRILPVLSCISLEMTPNLSGLWQKFIFVPTLWPSRVHWRFVPCFLGPRFSPLELVQRAHESMALTASAQERDVWLLLSFSLCYLSKWHGRTWVDRSGRYTSSEKECILANGNSRAPLSHGCPVTLPGSGLPFAFFKTSGSFSEESAEHPDPPDCQVSPLQCEVLLRGAVVYWRPVLGPGHTVMNWSQSLPSERLWCRGS